MAAGKSTVGRILARRLGREFVDLDERVVERTGRSAATIIREEGEASFRRLEARLTAELAGRGDLVLAPGGGWGATPELAGVLGPDTFRIWLRIPAAEAVRRAVASDQDRPLLEAGEGRADGEEAVRRAERLLQEREPFYAAAEMTVDVEGKAPADVVDEIVRRFGMTWEEDES
jgi:shikimate kinase